ncbi:MAG: 1-acyl-sn-glycerol-3-phosphate acyltransferase [Deltaproteobacteria bacterium]|nr:1-acyl-sn-glycerol-3-phosphate acyltransferase [Deltaproteobacteria bacterium]
MTKFAVKMLRALVRLAKGFYLFWMFCLFGAAIVFGLAVVVPVVFIVNRLGGHSFKRMQRVIRRAFSGFLALLRLGRLARSLPARGAVMDEPCVLVANHPGLFDVLFLIRDLPGVSVLVKDSLFPWMGPILVSAGYVPARARAGSFPSRKPLRDAARLLKAGHRFIVFPEGTRSPEGGLHPFGPWAVEAARLADVPLQPVVIHNRPPFLSHEQRWYYPPYPVSLFQLEFLQPVRPDGDRREVMNGIKEDIRLRLESRGSMRTSSHDQEHAA